MDGLEAEKSVSSSILNVTFDCSDAASVAQFWSEVTQWPYSKQEMPGNTFWVVGVPGGRRTGQESRAFRARRDGGR